MHFTSLRIVVAFAQDSDHYGYQHDQHGGKYGDRIEESVAVADSMSDGAIAGILLMGRGAAGVVGSEGVGKGDDVAGNGALGGVSLNVKRWVKVGGVERAGWNWRSWLHGPPRWHGSPLRHERHGRHRLAAGGSLWQQNVAGVVGHRLVAAPLPCRSLMKQICLIGPAGGNDDAENLAAAGHQVDGPHTTAQSDDGQ